jgi:2-polyprenyl-3-methyl-5-hydroxy-6-metoxy-1,4-benzoquinol methylase
MDENSTTVAVGEIYPKDYAPYSDDRLIRKVDRPSVTHRLRKARVDWLAKRRPRFWRLPLGTVARLFAARFLSLTHWYRFNPFSFVTSQKSILDVGCADGHFLLEMAALGWDPTGIEPDVRAAKKAGDRGIKIHHGAFDSSTVDQMQEGAFDLVTMRQVLEHMDDPVAALGNVRRLLRRGGMVAIWTPMTDSLAARLFRRFWYNLDLPRHRIWFSRNTLLTALRQAGFLPLENFAYSSSKSITGSLSYWMGNRFGKGPGKWVRSSPLVGFAAKVLVRLLDAVGQGDNRVVVAVRNDESDFSDSFNQEKFGT